MKTYENEAVKHNEVPSDGYQDAVYWKTMYEELEEQMKQMMIMTLDLEESGDYEMSNDSSHLQRTVKKQEKELRRYKQFEHRIKVTWIGKIALLYIAFKKSLKNIIKK